MPVFWGNSAQPVIVGHRGLRRPGVAENTPEAFQLGAAEGADWLELDVRRSRDGVPVLYHNGYTPDRVPVVARNAADLAAEFGIVTLAEALAGMPPGVGLNFEIKNLPGEPDYDPWDRIVATVAEAVRDCAATRPVAVSAFNPLTVSALRKTHPDLPVGFIFFDAISIADAIPIAAEFGADALAPRFGAPGLDEHGVAAAHAAGLELMVWTVNDPELARSLAAAGVDALCTDDPGGIRAALRPTPPA
jgi:glycerophosphoryl diester phosphodiesterase